MLRWELNVCSPERITDAAPLGAGRFVPLLWSVSLFVPRCYKHFAPSGARILSRVVRLSRSHLTKLLRLRFLQELHKLFRLARQAGERRDRFSVFVENSVERERDRLKGVLLKLLLSFVNLTFAIRV